MIKLHFYPVLLLLGILLAAPLHAAAQRNEEKNSKSQAASSHPSEDDPIPKKGQKRLTTISAQTAAKDPGSAYIGATGSGQGASRQRPPSAWAAQHYASPSLDPSSHKFAQKDMKSELIDLFQCIKAKDRRKVYFFLGGGRSGKSLSIAALQGNIISKRKEEEVTDSDDSDGVLFTNLDDRQASIKQKTFEITYVLPKDQVPVVGAGAKDPAKRICIYYPDAKKPQYQQIAFADTAGFFGKEDKSISETKCLSSSALHYALKANRVGGIVLVLSAEELDDVKGEINLGRFAAILQQYFAKATDTQKMKQSVLVMITKVDGKSSKTDVIRKLRARIQSCYRAYYAATAHDDQFKSLQEERNKLAASYQDVLKAYTAKDSEIKVLDKKFKQLEQVFEKELKKRKALDEKRTQLDNEYEDIIDKLKILNKNTKSVLKEGKENDEKIEKIEEQIISLTKRIKNLLKADQALTKSIQSKKINRKNIPKEREKLNKAYEKMSQEDKELKLELETLKQKREKIAQDSQKLEEKRETIEQTYEILRQQEKNSETTFNGLEQQCKALQQKKEKLLATYENLHKQSAQLLLESKKLGQSYENIQSAPRCVKLFYEMLLVEDVPKDKIGDINNFTLDKNRFCFILPWEAKSVQKILNTRLASLQPIPADDLCSFDNPFSQYIAASIRAFSVQLNEAIQPLLALRRRIDTIEKCIAGLTNKNTVEKAIALLEKRIQQWRACQKAMKKDNTLEAVFKDAHHENLPQGWEATDGLIDKCKGYQLCKAFLYGGEEPIYQIKATYGAKAILSETHPFFGAITEAHDKFNFIEKHFNIITTTDSSGKVTWKAVAKHGKGILRHEWKLYHATTGGDKAQCDVTFYALKRERIATRKRMLEEAVCTKLFVDEIVVYEMHEDDYNILDNQRKIETKRWEIQRDSTLKAWYPTAQMLQCFKDEILPDGAEKMLVSAHLHNFKDATQLSSFKSNHQPNKPNNEQEKGNLPDLSQDADENNPSDDTPIDNAVFDID